MLVRIIMMDSVLTSVLTYLLNIESLNSTSWIRFVH